MGKIESRIYAKKRAFCYPHVTHRKDVFPLQKHQKALYPEATAGARTDRHPVNSMGARMGKWILAKNYKPIEAHVKRPIMPSGFRSCAAW